MSPQEALWMLRAQCGDRDALGQLWLSLAPVLTRYLDRYTGRQDASQ